MSDSHSRANESCKKFYFHGSINKDKGLIIAIILVFYSDHEKSQQFYDLFDLKSIIQKEPSIIIQKEPSKLPSIKNINQLLTWFKSSQNSSIIETHRLIAAFVKSHFTRLDSKTVYDRNFQNYDKNSLLNDQKETIFVLSTNDLNKNYRFITDTLI